MVGAASREKPMKPSRATEYSKAATRGEWHGDDGVWSNFDKMMEKRKQPANL